VTRGARWLAAARHGGRRGVRAGREEEEEEEEDAGVWDEKERLERSKGK